MVGLCCRNLRTLGSELLGSNSLPMPELLLVDTRLRVPKLIGPIGGVVRCTSTSFSRGLRLLLAPAASRNLAARPLLLRQFDRMYPRLSSNTECLLSKTLERMMIEGRSCAQSQPVSQAFAIRRSNLPSCWNQSRHELGLALQYLLLEDPAAILLSKHDSNPSL